MDPILLQKQVRDNAQGLQEFCKELKEWGAEMNKKDESLKSGANDEQVRSNVRKTNGDTTDKTQPVKSTAKKSKRLKGCDYAAWEKFDADAHCAKVDGDESSDESELSDEIDVGMMDLANAEKEKGNKFVKRQRWDDAIKCYTKSIEYYAYDPIYYANRALCHLKKLSYRDAESDCTTALQLDKTYVKAYQRRAVTREHLNQLSEAHDDYLKVFEIEPNNKEAKAAFAKLEQKLTEFKKLPLNVSEGPRPVSKFTLSRQNKHKPTPETEVKPSNLNKEINAVQEHVIERTRPSSKSELSTAKANANADISEKSNKSFSNWPSGEKIQLFESVDKPPKTRSKTALRRIKIDEVDTISERNSHNIAEKMSQLESNSRDVSIHGDKLTELGDNEDEEQKELADFVKKKLVENNEQRLTCFSELNLPIPRNSVQFYNVWRTIKNNAQWQYMYLMRIAPADLPVIFKDSLESWVFSDIVKVLSQDGVRNDSVNVLQSYLLHLAEVKRFSALIMFMSSDDKKCVSKIFNYLMQGGDTGELRELIKKYEM